MTLDDRKIIMQQHRVVREIERTGSNYTFKRNNKNEFGEETEEKQEVCSVKALYHATKGYATRMIGESSIVITKGMPMLLCVKDEMSDKIMKGDIVEVNGCKHVVSDKNNVNEYNILYDISLEVVLNGNSQN